MSKQELPLLFHKIRGNYDEPSVEEIMSARESIEKYGLLPQIPDEWKNLLPKHLQSTPVVWLIGYDRMLTVNKNLLDQDKLFRLDTPEIDWWVYAGNIPSSAIDAVAPASALPSFALGIVERIFKEIEDYLITVRRGLQNKRASLIKNKPKEIAGAINLGAKLKAFQQVIDKVQALKKKEAHND